MDKYMSPPPSSQQPVSDFEDDDCRWEAVQSRNPKADGLFVYAVRSTRIYSRPSCKARLAQRANIAFFETGAQAQGAGYRPCKRCHPEAGVLMPEEDGVSKIRAFMRQRVPKASAGDEGAETMLSLSQMARQTGLSKWHFHRAFKKCFGVTPVEYLRMERKAARLGSTNESESTSSIPEDESHIGNIPEHPHGRNTASQNWLSVRCIQPRANGADGGADYDRSAGDLMTGPPVMAVLQTGAK